jgi:DNA polymerase-1
MVDYLALLGDQADNVKGVYGIGEKKALMLVYQYQTIENIYEHLSYIDPNVAKILADDREGAFASKQLVQLVNIDLSEFPLEKFTFTLDYDKYIDVLCNQH